MEYKLLTKKDLANRWNCSVNAVEKWVREGKLTPCRKIPGDIRFSEKYIAELEGIQLEKYSPVEYHRMERELQETKQQLDYYKSVVADMDLLISKVRVQQIKETQK